MKMNIKKYGLCCFYAFSVMGCGNNQLGARKRDVVEERQQRFSRKEGQRQLESQRHMNRSSQRILDRAPQWALNGETQWMLQAYQRMFNQAPQSTALRRPEWRGGFASLLFLTAYLSLVQGEDAGAKPNYSLPSIPQAFIPDSFFDTALFDEIIHSNNSIYPPSCGDYDSSILNQFAPIGDSEDFMVESGEDKMNCIRQVTKIYRGLKSILSSKFKDKHDNLTLMIKTYENSTNSNIGPTSTAKPQTPEEEAEKALQDLIEEEEEETLHESKDDSEDAMGLPKLNLRQAINDKKWRIYLFEETTFPQKKRSPQSWFKEVCTKYPLKERGEAFDRISVRIIKGVLKKSGQKCKDEQWQKGIIELAKVAEQFARFGEYERSLVKADDELKQKLQRNNSGTKIKLEDSGDAIQTGETCDCNRVKECVSEQRSELRRNLLNAWDNSQQIDTVWMLDSIAKRNDNCTGRDHWKCLRHNPEGVQQGPMNVCGNLQMDQWIPNIQMRSLIGQVASSTADLDLCRSQASTRQRRYLNTSHNHEHHQHRKHHHHKHHQPDQVDQP